MRPSSFLNYFFGVLACAASVCVAQAATRSYFWQEKTYILGTASGDAIIHTHTLDLDGLGVKKIDQIYVSIVYEPSGGQTTNSVTAGAKLWVNGFSVQEYEPYVGAASIVVSITFKDLTRNPNGDWVAKSVEFNSSYFGNRGNVKHTGSFAAAGKTGPWETVGSLTVGPKLTAQFSRVGVNDSGNSPFTSHISTTADEKNVVQAPTIVLETSAGNGETDSGEFKGYAVDPFYGDKVAVTLEIREKGKSGKKDPVFTEKDTEVSLTKALLRNDVAQALTKESPKVWTYPWANYANCGIRGQIKGVSQMFGWTALEGQTYYVEVLATATNPAGEQVTASATIPMNYAWPPYGPKVTLSASAPSINSGSDVKLNATATDKLKPDLVSLKIYRTVTPPPPEPTALVARWIMGQDIGGKYEPANATTIATGSGDTKTMTASKTQTVTVKEETKYYYFAVAKDDSKPNPFYGVARADLKVTLPPEPKVSLSVSAPAVNCTFQNEKATITAIPQDVVAPATYQWWIDGVARSTTGTVLTAQLPGGPHTVTVQVTSGDKRTAKASAVFTMPETAQPLPKVKLSVDKLNNRAGGNVKVHYEIIPQKN